MAASVAASVVWVTSGPLMVRGSGFMGILSCLTDGLPGLIAARASTALVSVALDSVFFVVTGAFNCTTTCFATFLDKVFVCGATGTVFLPTGLAIAFGSALTATFDPVLFAADFAAGFTTCFVAVFGAALTLALTLFLATGLAAAFFTSAADGAALTADFPVGLGAGLAGLATAFVVALAATFVAALVTALVTALVATLLAAFVVSLLTSLLTAFTLFAATARALPGAGFATSFDAGLFAFLALAGAAAVAFEVAGLTEVFAGFVIALAIKSQLKGYRAACAAHALNPVSALFYLLYLPTLW